MIAMGSISNIADFVERLGLRSPRLELALKVERLSKKKASRQYLLDLGIDPDAVEVGYTRKDASECFSDIYEKGIKTMEVLQQTMGVNKDMPFPYRSYGILFTGLVIRIECEGLDGPRFISFKRVTDPNALASDVENGLNAHIRNLENALAAYRLT